MSDIVKPTVWGKDVNSEITSARPYLNPGPVLDLGSGSGASGLWVAESLSSSLHAVDINSTSLEAVQANAPSGLEVRTTLADLEDFKLEEEAYETVICSMVLQFLSPEGLERTAREILRAVKPGGNILFSVFSLEDPSFASMQKLGNEKKVSPRVFRHDVWRYIRFFDRDEVLSLFPGMRVRVLRHSYFEDLSHGLPHFHGVWFAVLTKVA